MKSSNTLLKILYYICLAIFLYTLLAAPKIDESNQTFILFTLFTVGIPIMIAPLLMIHKAEKFYKKALREGRIEADSDKRDSLAEEEYILDIKMYLLLFSLLFLIMSYFLWK